MSYQVKLDIFEGPFDLLLNLISKHELDVYDIPLARIISDYLNYIKETEELDLEIASEFLVIAAILLDIKTSSLIPGEEEPEDELTEVEAREILISRLIEYKKFKNISSKLRSHNEVERRYFRREADLEEILEKCLARRPAESVVGDILLPAMKEVGERMSHNETILPHVLLSAEVMSKALAYLTPHLSAETVVFLIPSRKMPLAQRSPTASLLEPHPISADGIGRADAVAPCRVVCLRKPRRRLASMHTKTRRGHCVRSLAVAS